MQAIRTRYHGPTDTRGARITASTHAGLTTVPYDHALDSDGNHRAAAEALKARLGWTGEIRGGMYGNDYYWILIHPADALAAHQAEDPHCTCPDCVEAFYSSQEAPQQ